MRDLLELRKAKDRAFRYEPWSPIPDPGAFTGLRYFDPDPAYRVGAKLERARSPRRILMGTSDGASKEYVEVGRLRFRLHGEEVALTGYESHGRPHELFVPFRDATSGKETYGAGRYLEVELPHHGDEVVVDLNLAYNPYCAYSEDYSCPLPPVENWLKVPVRAGERTFAD